MLALLGSQTDSEEVWLTTIMLAAQECAGFSESTGK